MEIRLLGPVEVREGARVVPLPRRQQRVLLAALALRVGEVVSTDRLVADLWGERAPASATGSLQNTVSALRKALGRDIVVTQAPGYRLALEPESVDAHRFERLLAAARTSDDANRTALLHEALALWRGPALADLDEEHFARLEAARLDELRVAALEERIDAELGLGRHGALVGELETLVAAHPLRERLRGQLMLTLYRCGRQAEALEVYSAARLALADELGLDPSPELQELERKVLRQDPELAAPAEATDMAPTRTVSELKLVTVLAATPPGADDPEQHRLLLDETLTSVRKVLDRYGGVLERFGPEGLVAVFGAEGPADDDATRAVMAARELGLAAGVTTGEVVQGAGTVVTRAVELARVGGIRLDERTSALVSAERRLGAPLVGRGEELARLRASLADARESGRCRVVTLVGEPGIGKTRLARELALEEAAGTTVLVARCVAHGDGATFLPLLGALAEAEPERVLADESDADLVLARLGSLVGGTRTVQLGEAYWAVRRLLEALARTQPVLLVLDDVHWAEPALLDLIDYLADRADAPLLLLCLARPELERPLGNVVPLGPLRPDEAGAIVAGTAELDEKTRERIVELAEGNALYAEQLAAFAAEGGEGLPPTLEAVLAGRLGRLGATERSILQRAAVIGRDFSVGAVAALVGDEVARELLSLVRSGFLHPAASDDRGDDGYTFHHVLLRDAAYASVTKSDRGDLHERAAAWLDRDGSGDDALVGYHLEQAARYRRERGEDADALAAAAGERLGEAGMRIWRTNDPSAAAGLLERAVDLLPLGPRRAELACEWSLTLRTQDLAKAADTALGIAERCARDADVPHIAARVACERMFVRFFAGEVPFTEAVAGLAAATETLRERADARGLGRAELCLATVHALAGNMAEWGAAAKRAEAEYARAGFSPAAPIAIQAEALFYGAVPVAEAITQCLSLLDRSTDRMSEAMVTAVLGALHALAGRSEEARSLLVRSRGLFEDVGQNRAIQMTWVPLMMEAEWCSGNRGDAIALGRANVEALLSQPSPLYAGTRAAQVTHMLLDCGDVETAREYAYLAGENIFEADVFAQFLTRAALGRILAREGKLAEAEAMAEGAVELASLTDASCDRARAHLAFADVLARAGQDSAMRAQRAAAMALLKEKGALALYDERSPLGAPLESLPG
jgi:DNA-binding SARP family transcriptional activator